VPDGTLRARYALKNAMAASAASFLRSVRIAMKSRRKLALTLPTLPFQYRQGSHLPSAKESRQEFVETTQVAIMATQFWSIRTSESEFALTPQTSSASEPKYCCNVRCRIGLVLSNQNGTLKYITPATGGKTASLGTLIGSPNTPY
jgi:hypothetical protein